MRSTANKVKTGLRGRNGRTRFPGICEAAAAFGVTRQHLYFVLTGERRSPRIERSAWFQRAKAAVEGRP